MRLFFGVISVFGLILLGCSDKVETDQPTNLLLPDTVFQINSIVYFFGGTPTSGGLTAFGKGFVEIIQQNAYLKNWPHRILNAGIKGENAQQLKERLNRVVLDNAQHIVIEVGWDDFDQRIDFNTTMEHLEEILNISEKIDRKKLCLLLIQHPEQTPESFKSYENSFQTLTDAAKVPLLIYNTSSTGFWNSDRSPTQIQKLIAKSVFRHLQQDISDF